MYNLENRESDLKKKIRCFSYVTIQVLTQLIDEFLSKKKKKDEDGGSKS